MKKSNIVTQNNRQNQKDIIEKKAKKHSNYFFILAFLTVSILLIFIINRYTDLWLNLIITIMFLGLTFYLSIRKESSGVIKIVILIVGVLVLSQTIYKYNKNSIEQKKKQQQQDYLFESQERTELYGKGLTDDQVWKYEKDPLLKHTLLEADQRKNEGKFKIAINKYKSCLKHRNISLESKHWTNGNIANCYKSLGDFKKAEDYWEEARIVAEEIEDEMLKTWFVGRSYANLGTLFFSLNKSEKAIKLYQKALYVFNSGGAINGTAQSLYNVALTHTVLNNFDLALKSYEKSLNYAIKYKQRKVVANSLCNTAMVLHKLGKGSHKKVIDYCERALKEATSIRDKDCILRVTKFAGYISYEHNELVQSIKYHKIFLSYSKKNKMSGVINQVVGDTCAQISDYDQALKFYRKAISIFENLRDYQFLVISLERAGFLCANIGRANEAKNFWDRALKISREKGYKDDERKIRLRLKSL